MTARFKGEMYLLATTVIWGSTFAVQKIGLREISALQLNALRFGLGALFFLLVFRRSVIPVSVRELRHGFILGFLLFLGFSAQTFGLYLTTASKSAFITSLMVVFAPIFQVIIERRAPTIGNIVGISVVCLGLWLLTSPGESGFNAGDLLTLACAFLFGLYIVYLDIASREVPAVRLTFLQLAVSAAGGWIMVLILETPVFPTQPDALLALLHLTVLATIVTTLVQTRFQKDTTPTRAAVIFSIEPLLAALFASFLLGEIFGPLGVMGGFFIVSGILISELSDMIPVLRNQAGTFGRGDR
ncbi:MAG: DMT family transporter [Ignavibacteria bacterium]|nr:DMT family transporter [Ignavibacteria bacterium]